MPTVSASRIGSFLDCPFKYKLQYIDKIKTDKDGKPLEEGDALKFGSFMHKILEMLVKHLKNTDQKRDPAFVNDNFDWLWERHKVQDEERRYKAREMLAYFLARDIEIDTVRDVEILQGEDFDRIPNAQVWFRFDRVDAPDEKSIVIVDYKTGKVMPKVEELKDDIAYVIYSWAARKLYPDNEKYTIRWLYLDASKSIELEAMDSATAEAKLEPLARKMLDAKEFPKRRNRFCKWCEFLKIDACDMNLHTRIPK